MVADLPQKLDAAVRSVAAQLAIAGIEPAFTEARLIFELAGFERMALLKAPDKLLSEAQTTIIKTALQQRVSGRPVARMRGWSMLDGRRFELSPDTLEPRDDTLTLIDSVTDFVRQTPKCRILDIGTGTGVIALTLLARVADASALATDVSPGALKIAMGNAQYLQLIDRFQTQLADMLDGVSGQFDLVISNPPYIASAEIDGLEREVREHDPLIALDGGPDGLTFYRAIAETSGALLALKGQVAVEIGFDQRTSVAAVFLQSGFEEHSFHKDVGGRPRALVFTKG